jgi:hypothetical protein
MFGAFLGAGITNFGAEAADFTDVMRTAAHEGNAYATCFCTIDADACTVRPLA